MYLEERREDRRASVSERESDQEMRQDSMATDDLREGVEHGGETVEEGSLLARLLDLNLLQEQHGVDELVVEELTATTAVRDEVGRTRSLSWIERYQFRVVSRQQLRNL